MAKKSIHFRVEKDVYEALESHARSLKIPPNTLARELFENALHGRKEETILAAFDESEKRKKKESQKVEQELKAVKSKVDDHLYGVATAVFLFLSRDDENDEDRQETKEYIKQIFPFWRG